MRRIVLETADQSKIIGLSESQPPDMFVLEDRLINLVAVRRSYWLYRPVMSPSEVMEEFHKDQR